MTTRPGTNPNAGRQIWMRGMRDGPATERDLSRSVIAVPPLARLADLEIDRAANGQLIKHLEQAGITTLLYGGNANFYHMPLREYRGTLEFLIGTVHDDTWLIPSAGPDYGRLVDQADVLRDLGFPTAMVLPQSGQTTPDGVELAIRRFVERFGRAVILYLRAESYLSHDHIERLARDGLVAAIKYAIVRTDPNEDPFLAELAKRIEAALVVSGLGERPALVHRRKFGLRSFTSGSVCVAPRASMAILQALQRNEEGEAERLRAAFLPLEDLRDQLGPARVLHDAVTLSAIADMGRMQPMLSNLTESEAALVRPRAAALRAIDETMGRPASFMARTA